MKFTAKNEKCFYTINLKHFIDVEKFDSEQTWRFKGLGKVFNDVDTTAWITVRNALSKERAQLQRDIENNHKLNGFLLGRPTRQNIVQMLQDHGRDEADRPEVVERMLETQMQCWTNARARYWQFGRLDRLDKLIELWEAGAKMKRITIPASMFKNKKKGG